MEHKVNPHNLRVGVIKDWKSKWKLTNPLQIRINDFVALNSGRDSAFEDRDFNNTNNDKKTKNKR